MTVTPPDRQTLLLSPLRSQPPRLPLRAIQRPLLLQRLRDAAERGVLLSLVSAPLGYGKSVLLCQYANHLETPFAWYRCRDDDNQPLVFLANLSLALGIAVPEARLGKDDGARLWAAILAHLDGPTRFTLILDDLHLLRGRTACRYLDELLHFAPANLHLLAACEGLPALAFSHLRRDMRLQLLDARALSLDSADVRSLAETRGLNLGGDSLYLLGASNEGWLSGILFGLAAHAEQAPAQQAFDYTAQFLDEELLARLPNELLAFIERLSVVNNFNIDLAACLSGQPNAAQLILRLQREDLFIQYDTAERLAYSFHPVLRRTLYQRLGRRDIEHRYDLHRQAADWLLEQRCYTEAIYQLGRARDFNRLLTSIERHSFDLLREGKIKAIVDFLADVPGQVGIDHFTLAITEASALVVTNDIERGRACLLQLHRLLRNQQLPGRHPERPHQTAAFLRSRMAFIGGNFSHALGLVERALLHYPQTNAASAVLLFTRASCRFALGQLRSAHSDARQALGELEAMGFSGYTNSLHMLLGQIELASGRSEQAAQRYRSLGSALPSGPSRNFYDLFQQLGLGLVALQNSQFDTAFEHFNQAEAIALDFPHCAGLPWVFHYQACLHAALENPALARERWDESRRLARRYKLFGLYRHASACRARLAVRELDQAFILEWLEDWHWCRRHYGVELLPQEWLAYAWVQRHLGQHAAARQIIDNLEETAQAEEHRQLQLDLHLLKATLHLDHQERNEAFISLENALQLASRHGLGQLLQHEGSLLRDAFRQLLNPQVRRQVGLDQPLPPRDKLNALLRGLQHSEPALASQSLAEPLTRREQDVLRRMGRGQGNQQIAEGLFISLSTVKTHINNLFRKLDTVDREAAVIVARQLKLID